MNIEKASLRQEIRRCKQAYTPAQLREMSHPIIERLLSHPAVSKAHTIAFYHSLPDEVYTHDAIERLRTAGKQILLPRVTGEGTMTFLPYDGTLEKGAFGIMEGTPTATTTLCTAEVFVVPGIAFDREGHRLGRGGGYYDRFFQSISHHPSPVTIGLCFPFQLFDTIPHEDYDLKVDQVITSTNFALAN